MDFDAPSACVYRLCLAAAERAVGMLVIPLAGASAASTLVAWGALAASADPYLGRMLAVWAGAVTVPAALHLGLAPFRYMAAGLIVASLTNAVVYLAMTWPAVLIAHFVVFATVLWLYLRLTCAGPIKAFFLSLSVSPMSLAAVYLPSLLAGLGRLAGSSQSILAVKLIPVVSGLVVVGGFLASAAALERLWIAPAERASRPRAGHCRECGYNLEGNVSGVCPECGDIRIGFPKPRR